MDIWGRGVCITNFVSYTICHTLYDTGQAHCWPHLPICIGWVGVSKCPAHAESPQNLWVFTMSHNRHSPIRELHLAQGYRFAKHFSYVPGNEQKLIKYFSMTQSTSNRYINMKTCEMSRRDHPRCGDKEPEAQSGQVT